MTVCLFLFYVHHIEDGDDGRLPEGLFAAPTSSSSKGIEPPAQRRLTSRRVTSSEKVCTDGDCWETFYGSYDIGTKKKCGKWRRFYVTLWAWWILQQFLTSLVPMCEKCELICSNRMFMIITLKLKWFYASLNHLVFWSWMFYDVLISIENVKDGFQKVLIQVIIPITSPFGQ